MHLLNQQQKLFFCLLSALLTLTTSIPVKETLLNIRCNLLHQNCTVVPRNSSSNAELLSTYSQSSSPRTTTRSRTSTWPISTTSRQRSTTKSGPVSDFDAFSANLKRAALILAGIALGLGILRVCLMLCKSRSPNNSFASRHSATVQPHVATIEQHQFKPDLPPAYAEAMAGMEHNSGKLPAYEELPYEEQRAYDNEGFMSTQM